MEKLNKFLATAEEKINFAMNTRNESALQFWRKIRLNILDKQIEIIGGKNG